MNILKPISSNDPNHERNCIRPVNRISAVSAGVLHGISVPALHLATAVAIVVAVSACSNGHSGTDLPNLTVEPAPAQPAPSQAASNQKIETGPVDAEPAAPERIADLPEQPPVPTISPNEVVSQPPEPEIKPAAVPAPTPRETVEETVMVAEKPVSTVETVEIVETPERIVERTETVETSEIVIDRTRVDEQAGVAVEQVEVIERTETTVDTVAIDKQTGTAVETIVRSEPVEKETESVTVVVESTPMAPDGPMDSARLFTGPDQFDPSEYRGYGVFAIRLDTPPSERDRLVMLCDAFAASLPGKRDRAGTSDMVTVWPVTSASHADALNASSGAQRCEDAVERYAADAGQEAISDSERTGWILDNAGPYLLAWSPPADKGVSGASVLLVDLSSVSEPGVARDIMRHWSEDVERNEMLWDIEGWNPEELSRVIKDWRGEFGPRTILLLGTVGG